MDEERKRKHEAAQAAKIAASVNVRARGYIAPTTVEVFSSTPVDWKHWGKLKSVRVFEALALLSNTEPSEEPQEPEDASPEYRKRHRLLLDSLADRTQFTAGTLNMGNASLNGVFLIEVARWAVKLNIPNMPPELVAMAVTEPMTTPAQNTATPAPVAVAALGGTEQSPDPERRLAQLRALGGTAKFSHMEWKFTGMAELVKSEKSEGRKRSDQKTIRADLKEAAQAERDAKNAGFATGLGKL